MRPKDDPYEIWENESIGWVWKVLKKWQSNDYAQNARWFCLVETPIVPQGELGDCYVSDIRKNSERIK